MAAAVAASMEEVDFTAAFTGAATLLPVSTSAAAFADRVTAGTATTVEARGTGGMVVGAGGAGEASVSGGTFQFCRWDLRPTGGEACPTTTPTTLISSGTTA